MGLYQGSCHCGAVRFEAEIDLQQPTWRCNCTYCQRIRCWAAPVAPARFRLLSGADALSDYRFGARREHHYFCRHCGVRPFGKGDSPARGAFYGVSVACLEGLSAEQLAAIPVLTIDGRNERWDSPSEVSAYL